MTLWAGNVRCPRCHGSGKIGVFNGAKARTVRERAGLSLRKFGEQVGYSATYLSDIENGHRQPNLTIAQAYGRLDLNAG